MARKFKCTICGKSPLSGENGAKGHVKFSGGDHGSRMELPDNWESAIEEIDDSDPGGSDLPETCRKCGDREREEGSMTCEQCSDSSDEGNESSSPDPDESSEPTDSNSSLLKTVLYDDVTAILRR